MNDSPAAGGEPKPDRDQRSWSDADRETPYRPPPTVQRAQGERLDAARDAPYLSGASTPPMVHEVDGLPSSSRIHHDKGSRAGFLVAGNDDVGAFGHRSGYAVDTG